MIILHNIHDKASRQFVATHGATDGVTVLDWYNEIDRQQWLDAGGTLAISAFPSVLLRHDTYTEQVDDGSGGTVEQTTEAGWDVLRTPTSIDPLPTVGNPVAVGLYTYNGAYLICRQAHTRTIYEPSDTPALFSTWRADSTDMIWIANEAVVLDDERIYDGIRYKVIQAHTTQEDWRPDLTPALWVVVEAPGSTPDEWAASVYALDALVTHSSRVWKSLMNGNAYEPGIVGTWRDQSVPPLWVQPAGSIGLWQSGDVCEYNGHTWQCTSNSNSYAPGVYGWTMLT